MKTLAMDIGGSGGKLLLGEYDGRRISLKEIHRFNNGPVRLGDGLYWDILMLKSQMMEGIRKAAGEGFQSMGIESFCNDYSLLDVEGNLFSQVRMYRDKRTEGIPEKMDALMDPMELYRRTGNQRARFNTLVQMAAQKLGPQAKLFDMAERFLYVPDLLNHELCGSMSTEYTIASVSQAFDQNRREWDDEIISLFGLPRRIFPEVLPPATLLGQARRSILDATGAEPFNVVTVCEHDTASAVLAVPSLQKDFAYISSGTWSLMGTETGAIITAESAFRFNFANEGGFGYRNRFLKNIMGLWLIQEIKRELDAGGIQTSYEQMDAEAEHVPPLRSLIDPDDEIFYPAGDMAGRVRDYCARTGQPVPASPGELNRCVKESLALAYRRTLEKIEAETGKTIPCVHIIGGGAQSTLLNRFAASAMDRTVLAGPFEATALGNTTAQLAAAGEIKDIGEARQVIADSFKLQEFVPQDRQAWEDAYGRFLSLCKQQP
jgi:rhamnulokinase